MHELFASTAAATDWERVRPVLDDAMRDLAAADREAVLLRFFEQRPFAEIGAALNVTDDAARMRVDRALEKLRALLARRAFTCLTRTAIAPTPAAAVATLASGRDALPRSPGRSSWRPAGGADDAAPRPYRSGQAAGGASPPSP